MGICPPQREENKAETSIVAQSPPAPDSPKPSTRNAEVYYNRGTAYLESNQYEEAFASFNQAIELNPQYVEAYYNRGLVYQNLNQYKEAIADYNQAATLFQQQNNPCMYQIVQQQLERLSQMEAQ